MRISVFIPAWYVKNKEVDFPAETLSCLGDGLRLRRGRRELVIPPPSIGVFSLLELAGSEFFRDPAGCSADDVALAAACAVCRETLLPWDRPRLDRLACRLKKRWGRELVEHYPEFVKLMLESPFTGYEMLRNKSDAEQDPSLFAGPAIARAVTIGAEHAGLSAFESIWRMPLTLAGHLAAANDAGKLPPRRPKDRADLLFQQREAIRRELAGELHPWQIREPEVYGLSQRQIEIRSKKGIL